MIWGEMAVYVRLLIRKIQLVEDVIRRFGIEEDGIVDSTEFLTIRAVVESLPDNVVFEAVGAEYLIKYASKIMALVPITMNVDAGTRGHEFSDYHEPFIHVL